MGLGRILWNGYLKHVYTALRTFVTTKLLGPSKCGPSGAHHAVAVLASRVYLNHVPGPDTRQPNYESRNQMVKAKQGEDEGENEENEG